MHTVGAYLPKYAPDLAFVAPLPRNIFIFLGKCVHLASAQNQKTTHPTAKVCTSGAGCTANFGHC